MPIEDFLLPVNAGKQVWQMLQSNVTPGDHPYNFKGMCQALVSQWFVELRFAAGKSPDELGRYLLQANLGSSGYGGIAKAQASSLTVDAQSGGALNVATGFNVTPLPDATTAAMVVLTMAYGVDTSRCNSAADAIQAIDLAISGGNPRVFTAHMSLSGVNGWLLSKLMGATWGHAIGVHCNGMTLYVFDPNYGVFTIQPISKNNVTNFFRDLWAQYSPNTGGLAEVRAATND